MTEYLSFLCHSQHLGGTPPPSLGPPPLPHSGILPYAGARRLSPNAASSGVHCRSPQPPRLSSRNSALCAYACLQPRSGQGLIRRPLALQHAPACPHPYHPTAAPSLVPYLIRASSPASAPAGSRAMRPPQARVAASALPRVSSVPPVAPPLECMHTCSRATRRESQPLATTERALPNGGGYEISVGSDPRYFVSPLVAAAAAEAARPTFFPPHRPPSGHFYVTHARLQSPQGSAPV